MKYSHPTINRSESLPGIRAKRRKSQLQKEGVQISPWANKSAQRGFTIVELLIVIVIIAILAAITIVAYNGIQNRANDSAVQADLSSNAKILAMYQVEFGAYPTPAQLGTNSNRLKFTRASYHTTNLNGALYCRNGDGSQMSLIVRSNSGRSFYVSHATLSPTVFPSFAGGYTTDCLNSGVDVTTTTGAWISSAGNGGIWASWVD